MCVELKITFIKIDKNININKQIIPYATYPFIIAFIEVEISISCFLVFEGFVKRSYEAAVRLRKLTDGE